jgi:hypothetical protein
MNGFRIGLASLAAGALIFGGALAATAAQEGDAQVRVVHASPDAPAVDVFVNGDRAIENLAFGEATDLIPLPAGEYDVAVAPTGAPIEDAVITATLALEADAAYNVAATGTIAEGTLGPQVYPIDVAPLADGQARVRAVHASPDAPAVDVAVAGGPVLFSSVEFPNASDYADVDAGTYDLEVRPAGTADVALALDGVQLDAGTVYDVFAIGTLADGTLQALPLAATPSGVGAAELPSTTEAARAAAGEAPHTVPDSGIGTAFSDGGTSWLALAAAVVAIGAGAMAFRGRFAGR